MSVKAGITLLENITTDTSGTGIWSGGLGTWEVSGEFDGATVVLEYQADDGTWLDMGVEAALTAPGVRTFVISAGTVRARISGSGASTDINSRLRD